MKKDGPTKPNRSGIATPNDRVMTPDYVAKLVVGHFSPHGVCLDPARGNGAFYNQLPKPKDWCEIDEGKDFLTYSKKVDWIITNPPFSIYDNFLLHALSLADNIVFLTPLSKTFKSRKIEDAVERYGGLKEVLMFGGGGRVGFPFGFQVGCLYYKRNYHDPITLTRNYL